MDNAGDFQNVGVKQAQRVGVGEHQTGGIRSHGGAQGVQIHAAFGIGGHRHHRKTRHDGGSRVGAVGGIRHNNFGAGGVATALMVAADEQQAGVLSVGACGRLQRHAVHAGDLTEHRLGFGQHLEAPLDRPGGLEGMNPGKSGQRGHLLVDAGIVFHGARAERVKAAVDAVNMTAQLRIVAAEIGFADLRQGGSRIAHQLPGQIGRRHIAHRQHRHAAAGNTFFKNQLHFSSTSLQMAMARSSAARSAFSVAHHRIPPFSTGSPPRISAFSNASNTSSARGISVTNSWKKGPV